VANDAAVLTVANNGIGITVQALPDSDGQGRAAVRDGERRIGRDCRGRQ
jgi:hypothetical protein